MAIGLCVCRPTKRVAWENLFVGILITSCQPSTGPGRRRPLNWDDFVAVYIGSIN